ncbi:MAG: hypothetical protein H6838_13365 [Planctomycetes bacterium]|nr:hypothetical protein [Planctomycetota bacterium]MCB9886479.1 hypothetical protein [Planctomycetota bacterium]
MTQPLPWAQARALALAAGGDLATVRTADEQDWLYRTFGGSQALWIGYTDDGSEGTWRWVDNSTTTYTAWAPGQPDNQGGAENWAALSPASPLPLGANGSWLDLNSTFACPGLIEVDPQNVGRAAPYGAGCAGSNGAATLRAVNGAAPVPGSLFTLQLDSLPLAPTIALPALGLPLATPLNLAVIGMPGCDWYVDIITSTVVLVPGGSSATWTFAVPVAPALRGVRLSAQAAVGDPGFNSLGATVTNALAMTFGQGVGEVALGEDFATATFLDRDASGGDWGMGAGTFATIGGDARHGSFRPELGIDLGVVSGVHSFRFDTGNTTIPATQTATGTPLVVTDGQFYFDTMVVPAGVRLEFVGQAPPVFHVAGRLQVFGQIDVRGESLTTLPSNVIPAGQPGGAGGVFGGNGGQGGDKCLGVGAQPNYSGRDGEPVHVLAGHAYAATATATGGHGSSMFPASGLSTSLIFGGTVVAYSPSAAAGGGGGGLLIPGASGRVVSNNHPDPILMVPPRLDAMGPPAPGGAAMQLFPFVPTPSQRSSSHFLLGGAGGGGGGSHACLTISLARVWSPGGGGGGGGGAVALRAGDLVQVGAQGSVLANGGDAASITGITSSSSPAPGGGGSGGSIVVQSGRDVDLVGSLDVRGGQGGRFDRFANGSPNTVPLSAAVVIEGGFGSQGFVRCEVPQLPPIPTSLLPNMQPSPIADNVGTLVETDDLATMQSRFYDTGMSPGPTYVRYVIDADVDGVPMRFSDDPGISTTPAAAGAPLRAWFQAATLDPVTGQPTVLGSWRTAVRGPAGLGDDHLAAFRFRLVRDRVLATTVAVRRVTVVYRL